MEKTGKNRDIIDKFYTKKEIVRLCCEKIKETLFISYDNDMIIEPSCGNGAFIDEIKNLVKTYSFFDLAPEHDEIQQLDFLTYTSLKTNLKKIHVIGNPPFGRQSSLALKFIRKACEFASSFSFILPKSFKKQSLQNKIPLTFHLLKEIDLPKNSFLLDRKEYDVPCVFQIWIKKDKKRVLNEKEEPKKFQFVKKNEDPHFCFRRVGVYAGKIDTEIETKSEQSHYFIKLEDDVEVKCVIEKLKTIDFTEATDTVGPKSISKQELIRKFNERLYTLEKK